MNHSQKVNRSEIFTSTFVTGCAAIVTILMGMLRAKVLAVNLGPDGIGMVDVFATILLFTSTFGGGGINGSGVQIVAEAVGNGDYARVSKIAHAIGFLSIVFGGGAGILLAVSSGWISSFAFGSRSEFYPIMFLGIGVLLTVMANSNLVLIQGLRLIVNLGKINIASAIIGTSLGLLFVLRWGTYGIVPMLLTIPTVNLACSLRITRKTPYQEYSWFCKPRFSEIHDLVRLGFSFMISVLLANGVGLLLRILIIKEIGITAAGNFAAAYSLAGVYTGFILQAMAADFYPRLAANNKDRDLTNRLVNEQTEIALDLALPGILGTIVFAPWVVNALYTDSFQGATEVLQWQVVGMFGRIVTWPIGFILIAKGESFAFIVTESVSCLVYIFSAWAGLKLFGLMGVGIAFIVLYVFYAVMILLVSKQLTGFKWSVGNQNRLLWMLPTILIVMVVTFLMSRPWSIMVGSLFVVVSVGISCRSLLKFVPENVFRRT